MTIKDLGAIDDKLLKMYEHQVTTNTPVNYTDRSEILLEQMNFIALNNKSFLNINYSTRAKAEAPAA